jgi:cytochrome c oxidase cbb3-type subunit 1
MSVATIDTEGPPFGAIVMLMLSVAGAIVAVCAAAVSKDPAFVTATLIFCAACIAAAGVLTAKLANGSFRSEPQKYADGVIKAAVIASIFWGIVGMTVGVLAASQLAFPNLFYFPEFGFLNFGRIRPLHVSAVVFAFGGNVLIATSLYVVQRTCRARLPGPIAPWFVFWGYQLFIVMAAVGYLMGVTTAKEYAEPEWYNNYWLTIVWVTYTYVFLDTIWRRKERHIFVANWFFIAFLVTIAVLHIVNTVSMPVSLLGSKSYSAYSGVQDALIQWWYGHNAVGFFLTVPFLAIMYYFIPKRVERPIYSYRLSIVHFWALIFIYIWAGPHHLHYTALPQWAQTLGMTFSIMLWMPSWGGMINGLMTLSGAWDKLRTDPVVRMLIVALAFYGMSTFEGPVMSVRTVNALSHYTDWTIGHVHSGALGWVGFISFGALYCMTPWLWRRERLYSDRLVEWHFWISTLGILLYISSMWVAGIQAGLMWRAYTPDGFLAYSFVQSVEAKHPEYVVRALGGLMYLAGTLIMAYNLARTIRGDVRKGETSAVSVKPIPIGPAQPAIAAAE